MNLYERFKKLKDYRRAEGKRHGLSETIIIVTMATMSGYFGIRAIGDFIQRNREDLLKILKPNKNRLPSFNTVSRILRNVDFNEVSQIFFNWSKDYVQIEKKEMIALDGKAIKGTVKNYNTSKQKYINLVSAFSQKRKEILGLKQVNNKKESEIPRVRELIKELDLEGVVFTIDALHCQKNTTKTIIESKNDYIIGVKGNQKKLYNQIKKT